VGELDARGGVARVEDADQVLAQRQAGAVQPALERGDLDADHARGFLRAQPLDVAQDQHFALLVRQRRDRAGERRRDLVGVGLAVGRRRRIGHLLVDRARGMHAAALLDAEASGDLVKPRRERGVAAEARQVAERGEHRLLQDLARRLLVAAHAQPEAVDRLLVPREQLVDGDAVAGAGGVDQVAVVVRWWLHASRNEQVSCRGAWSTCRCRRQS
jgi:hypothetical protein